MLTGEVISSIYFFVASEREYTSFSVMSAYQRYFSESAVNITLASTTSATVNTVIAVAVEP